MNRAYEPPRDPSATPYESAAPGSVLEDFEARRSNGGTRVEERPFSLFRRLIDEVTTLFAKELALLKAETTGAIHDTRAGIGAMAAGGAVTFAGFLFLLTAATFGLAQVVEPWLAALIVGGVVTLIGLIMLSSGKKKLEPRAFKPTRTAASLREDRDMIRDNVKENMHKRSGP